jgi:UDP-N-acetyl-D-galactosamine dehydrogenase
MKLYNHKIVVIGLGYVGLPLAVEFGRRRRVIGYDLKSDRILELRGGYDQTLEVSREELAQALHLEYTNDLSVSLGSDPIVFIITVPTPVDKANRPDLAPLIRATETVGRFLKPNDIVIYESTVYPGATEEVCVPILEQESGLVFNKGFFCGYSPERVNPGDKNHKLADIVKVTSGSTPEIAHSINELYLEIVRAGTHLASSIRVAEAAKVIENTQRDVNIALINELSLIFNKLGIDTLEVLEAAGTKWNFLRFSPGLVGGHCIGVDPYYLTHKAQEVGHHSEVILAGRRINDGMAKHVVSETIKLMLRKGIQVLGSNVLVLGLTFKENCPDLRNTKVVDIVLGLNEYQLKVDIYDPWIDVEQARQEYGLECLSGQPPMGSYDAIIIAVGHEQFLQLGEAGIKAWRRNNQSIIYDVKGILPLGVADGRL